MYDVSQMGDNESGRVIEIKNKRHSAQRTEFHCCLSPAGASTLSSVMKNESAQSSSGNAPVIAKIVCLLMCSSNMPDVKPVSTFPALSMHQKRVIKL
jgi:hypothetical protein